MERLTKKLRNYDGTAISKESLINREFHEISDYCSQILTKLADYEDAEEQGLLLRLEKPLEENLSKEGDNKDVT